MNARWPLVFPPLDADGRLTTIAVDRPDGSARPFGGHLSALSVWAASQTAPGFVLRSLHSYYLRPPVTGEELIASPTEIRTGRRFAQRQVSVEQNGRVVFLATVSLQTPDLANDPADGRRPPEAPGPEALVQVESPVLAIASAEFFEIRAVRRRPLLYWARCRPGLGSSAIEHAAAFASLTDFGLVRSTYPPDRPMPLDQYGQSRGVSLDHGLWLHRQPRADAWHLFDLGSVAASATTGLSGGRAWTEAGELCATYLQDVLLGHDPEPTPRS